MESELLGYPKYQYSEFTKLKGRDGQFVIRANTWEEFLEEKKKIDLILVKEADGPPNAVQEVKEPSAMLCGIHGKPMTLIPAGISKTSGKHYPAFYVCNEMNANGTKCTYKPPKTA